MRSSSRARLGLCLLLVLAIGLGLFTSFRGLARAVSSPHIWLSQKVAPPTASLQVNGGGFGQSETVSIDFDTTQIGRATTDTTGKFAGRITVPKTALPGAHTVQATGQSSGLTTQASFLVRADWAQYGFGPYHTSYNPYENVISSSNVSTLTLDWNHPIGSHSDSPPTVANGLVYIGTYDGKLHAIDAITGAFKWNYSTGGSIYSSPAVANGVVYVGSDKLYALDATTGALKWSYNTVIFPLAVTNGVVYVGSGYPDDKTLYALDATTGALKWSYTMGGYIYFAAVARGVVYVGSGYPDDKLYALDAVTGAFKWSEGSGIFNSPAIANGVIYISQDFGMLVALDAITGALKWSYTTSVCSDLAVANGVTFYASGGYLVARDAQTGRFKLRYPTIEHNACSSPVVANGMVYTSESSFAMLSAFHLPGMN